jgi:hypothetical protein
MGESERRRLRVLTPGNEPIARGLDLFGGFSGSIFELDSSNDFDFTIVTGDGEASGDDVVEIDHGSDDNVGPFGTRKLWRIRCSKNRGLGELEIPRVDPEEPKGFLEIVA